MRLEFAHMQENIEACEATIAASQAVLAQMAECLASRDEFDISDYIAEERYRALLCIATDGERADGRLAWVPGA